ncbi:cytochrome p450 [Hirsutella rhossiliensis]|uniref:Cytochrome p450 domain-containing protein n=1 Tax=Hirsutella rhossiliensis TaxID=111463 RepID=A0A9P8MT17_9HYPO|nr:cytochrome p450 domain-containing protein [Hirsutella rhossiliensis]KAH0959696.1 cytochrome p450 domain-containing protein [Hirsutella rhossiliensis]
MESQTSPPPGAGSGFIATYLQQPAALAALVTLLVMVAAVRAVLSGPQPPASSPGPGCKSSPPKVPFWVPFFGHAPQMLLNTDGFLARLRDRYPEGVFSLRLCGNLHHIVHGPSMVTTLLNRPKTAAETPSSRVLVSIFGCSKQDQAHHATMANETLSHFKHLLSEPGLSELVSATVIHVKQHIADLVTFNSSPADQADWERMAGADVVEGPQGDGFVEADLTELTRNFIAKTANCALYGTDFVDNFPDLWSLLWIFDDAFLLLAARIPAWVPWPRLQRARLAQRRTLGFTHEFNVAMDKHLRGEDPGVKWQDLDNVSAVVRARLETFQRHGLSMKARASCDLALLWAMNANANQLIPWMLFELYRDPVLLEQVREEILPYVQVTQPENDFGKGVWLPAVLEHLDLEGLVHKCPMLKAAYIETLRVYTGTWTMRRLNEDVTLDDRGKAEPFLLGKGTYAHIAQEMHQMDPEYFPDPGEWRHERHLREHEDEKGVKTLVADMGTVRPYGGGPAMCKGRTFALREMLLYSAIIITFYDMQPPKGQSWEAPKTYKPMATRHPKTPIKVWIKRREQPSGRQAEGEEART